MSTLRPDEAPPEGLAAEVERRAHRIERAERDQPTVLGQTVYLGVLGLLFVLPVVGGAYLGRWLDGLFEGYSLRWTLSLLLAGVALGGANVYFFVRRR